MSVKVFVIEDDPVYSNYLKHVLDLNPDIKPKFFDTGKSCIDALGEEPDIVTLDYTLPDMAGEDVLRAIREYNSDICVIVVSAQENIETAVGLLKMGAYDYITKDSDDKNRILNSIRNAQSKLSLINEIDRLQTEVSTRYNWGKSIIGNSPAIKRVFELIEKAIKTNITVSITGETGTGKELVAKAIHYNSNRRRKPLVTVNVAAIPKDLIESELFGHERGSFTGAVSTRIGKFEEATGGTLFLDEIAEMDLNLQSKLLRVLQEKEITRIGSNQVLKVDVRIIVATHRNLKEAVSAGKFREDLFYRLLGLPINIPPLRDRGNDIITLTRYFLDEFAKENNLPKMRLTSEASNKLLNYPFPGNVRELKSIIDLAAVMANGDEITEEDITLSVIPDEKLLTLKEMTLQEYIYSIVRAYLIKYDNNVIEVAKKLDIGKSSIYRYLKEMKA